MKKLLFVILMLFFWSSQVPAIYIGSLTFSMADNKEFITKKILNNNSTARVYQVSISRIDSPSDNEIKTRPADGEILFSPKSLALEKGSSDFFKFFYHGPNDDQERYYRVSFTEIPTESKRVSQANNAQVTVEPIVNIESILVIRPRKIDFSWNFDKEKGVLTNTGNTFFKVLFKPNCEATEEEGHSYYLRPKESVHDEFLTKKGDKIIIYNDNFHFISNDCKS